jgi:hypothetical protein
MRVHTTFYKDTRRRGDDVVLSCYTLEEAKSDPRGGAIMRRAREVLANECEGIAGDKVRWAKG